MTNNQLEIRNFIGAFLDVVIVYIDHVEVKFKFKASNDFNYLDSCTCTRENLIARYNRRSDILDHEDPIAKMYEMNMEERVVNENIINNA
jgi:hypothetical protein